MPRLRAASKNQNKNMLKVATLTNIFAPARPKYGISVHGAAADKPGQPWLAYALIAVNSALLLSYLLGVNSRASTGYEIKQLQNKVQQLNEEQKNLNLRFSESTAISAMSQDFQQGGFVQAGSPKYITVSGQPSQTAMK